MATKSVLRAPRLRWHLSVRFGAILSIDPIDRNGLSGLIFKGDFGIGPGTH